MCFETDIIDLPAGSVGAGIDLVVAWRDGLAGAVVTGGISPWECNDIPPAGAIIFFE